MMADFEGRGAPGGRWNVLWHWLVPVLVLLAGTLWLRAGQADLEISGFYHAEGRWPEGDSPIFRLLYDRGNVPAIAMAAVALLVLCAGFFAPRWRRWRKVSAYLILVVILGPALLVNAVFKEHWGRPRPREVVAFGGEERFERVWEFDAASPGKSFPSGHASMGFCLVGLYFAGAALGIRRAWVAAAAGGALGLALGWARIAQGGHFASDVLWSAGFCYFSALGLAYGMRLRARPYFEGAALSRAGLAVLALAALGAVVVGAGMPYEVRETVAPSGGGTAPREIDVELLPCELAVVPGDRLSLAVRAEGFGAWKSGLRTRWSGGIPGDERLRLRQSKQGWPVTMEQRAKLTLPAIAALDEVEISVPAGGVAVDLPAVAREYRIDAGSGSLELRIPDGVAIKVSRESVQGEIVNEVADLEWSPAKGRWKRGEEPEIKVRVVAGAGLRLVRREGGGREW